MTSLRYHAVALRCERLAENGLLRSGHSLTDARDARAATCHALAKKDHPPVLSVVPETVAAPSPKQNDGRMATTIRIEPERLEALKILAAKRRVRVNDLLLEGVNHVLALHRSSDIVA